MRRHIIVVADIGSAILAGCAKQKLPPAFTVALAPMVQGRAGEYLQPDGGQQAWLPADLPPSAGSDRALFNRVRAISHGRERPEQVGSNDGSHARSRRAVFVAVEQAS